MCFVLLITGCYLTKLPMTWPFVVRIAFSSLPGTFPWKKMAGVFRKRSVHGAQPWAGIPIMPPQLGWVNVWLDFWCSNWSWQVAIKCMQCTDEGLCVHDCRQQLTHGWRQPFRRSWMMSKLAWASWRGGQLSFAPHRLWSWRVCAAWCLAKRRNCNEDFQAWVSQVPNISFRCWC